MAFFHFGWWSGHGRHGFPAWMPYEERAPNMIDLKDFRENPHKYRHAAEVKRVNVDVDHVLHLDSERLRSQQAFEQLRAEQNESSRQIAALKDATARQAAIARGADLKARVKQAEDRTKTIEDALLPLL